MAEMVKAVLFDAYGTLLDVHSAVTRLAPRVGKQAGAVSALWRQRQLEYTWILSATGEYESFDILTARALDFALASHGIVDASLREDLLAAYLTLDAHHDALECLAPLRAAGLRTAILSNGEPRMLDAGVDAAGLRPHLEAVLSVHPLRRYKPHVEVYALGTELFSLPPSEIGFVSSNPWDAHGAWRFGYRVFWANRSGQPVEYALDAHATVMPGLSPLPGLLGL
jgi:2-haloacid dehalogenase